MAQTIPSSAEGYLVNDEVWETETYRNLFGKWSSPIAKPRYSNVGGADKLSNGPNETFPVLEPPDGWDVVDGDWVLWPGTMSLTSDRDGWMYGKGYPDIVKQVQQGEDCGSSDEVRRGATVRRRRWIRTRRCVTPRAQDVVRAELVWLRSIVESLKVSMRSKREDHLVLVAFEEQRSRAYKEARTASAHRVIAFKDVLVKYQDNLANMKAFMRERMALDRDYSRRLTKLSDTFLGNKSGKDVGNEGFFSIVAGSSAAASRQFEDFASELEADRWPDLEATVATIGSLMRKCDVEALELWNRTRSMESSAVHAFKAYNRVYSASCCKGVESIERIAKVLAQADESRVLETGSLSDLLSGGIYGGALSEMDKESGTTPSSSSFTLEAGECDVYSCVHQYRVLVSKSLRGHDTIERFTNFIERDTKNIAANVATVVRKATDVFCDHQGSMWSDLGREMCFKGSATRQRAQTMLVAVTELGADQLDELPTAATKRLISVTSDGSGDGGGNGDGSSIPPLAPSSSPHGGEDDAMNMQSAVDEVSNSPLAAAADVGDGEEKGMVHSAGAKAKLVFNMKDLPPESRTVVASGHFLVASADDAVEESRGDTGLGVAVWSAVRLIATADGYVHFFRENDDNGRSSDASDEARGLFSGQRCPVDPVRSVRLERAAVRLAMLPGHDEALEISVHKDFMGSSVTAMLRNTGGPGGSSSSGSGRKLEERWEFATRLVVHADGTGLDSGSESMRDWIRLLHNPLADPSLAPPHLD